jgi:beta-galactosidase GanA
MVNADPPDSGSETPFLLGCDWPTGGSDAVKSLFYETGCNFARLTGGGYGWALESHRQALKELNAHGVRVLLQLGSHYPDGHYFAFKDSYFVDQKGETGKEDRNSWAINYSGSTWPQYSYASETFRKELFKDFASYLDGLNQPTNVAALLLHNEPGYHWLEDRVFDYNPQSIARFRVWLKQKLGTVENLNRHWGTQFSSFDVVEPPHDLPPVTNIAAWLDWRRFNADLIEDFLTQEVAFAHRIRPGIPVTTNLPGPLDNWYPIRLSDNYRFTRAFDISGIDIYPAEWTTPIFPGYTMDMTRGAAPNHPIYVAECEVFDPARFPGLSEEQRAGMLRSELWTFIGHGADGVLLWSLSGQGGFHLTDGAFNERVAATREIAHYAKMLHVGAFPKPVHRIAVCIDQDSYLYFGGREPKLEGGSHVSLADRGLYSAVVAGGYEADVISAAQLRQGIGRRYQALVLSTPILMDAELAAKLRAFVNEGGLLIAEAPFAQRDRWGQELSAKPGFGLDKILGIESVRQDTSGGDIVTPNGTFAALERTQFQLAGAQVVGFFTDKKPAVTVHRFGKGTAIYIAAEVGAPNGERFGSGTNADFGLGKFVAMALAHYAGLKPLVLRTHVGSAPAYLDTSVRTDTRGNQLVVLTSSPNHGKPLPPITGVTLSLTTKDLPPTTQAFIFAPAQHSVGHTMAGPQPILIQRVAGGRSTLALPDVASALPVLFAQDFPPLVAVDAPEVAAAGSEFGIQVTCYNPSPRPLRIAPTLVLPPSWQSLTPETSLVLPAYGESRLVLRVRSGGGERTVVKARISYRMNSQEKLLDSVPVDIFAARQ